MGQEAQIMQDLTNQLHDMEAGKVKPLIPTEESELDKWCREQTEKHTITFGDEMPEQQNALAFYDTQKQEMTVIGTLGNILTIIGRAKVRKTFFTLQLIVAMLIDGTLFGKIVSFIYGKTVLYIDTEQSQLHVMRALTRICRLMNVTTHPANLKVLGLRTLSPEERVKIIEYNIRTTPNLGAVVIDGARDLLYDILCPREAVETVSHLMKWTEIYNVHLITVLHQNKGDQQARGHIGTELVNKSETVIEVSLDSDKELSIVTAQQCRDREFEPFAFAIDDSGLPYVVEDFKPRATEGAKTKSAADALELERYKQYELLMSVYSGKELIGDGELVSLVKYAYKNQYNRELGTNKAKEFLTSVRQRQWLTQSGAKKPWKLEPFTG